LKNNKKNFYYYCCDLTNKNLLRNLIEDVKNRYKSLDIIINNASYTGQSLLKGWSTDFKKQNTENWKKVFDVSLSSNFELSKGFFKLLKKNKKGKIINVGSIYGFMGPDWDMYKNTGIYNPAGYGISKSGIIYLTKWLAATMAPYVTVNCVSPGGVLRKQPKKFIKNYLKKVPLKRMCTENDVVNTVIFLSSDLSNYITGQNIILDGGLSLK
jgi:NAD(P)-dependent dehydrogenase (short-subunit alcohol dehydrogenase family)